MRLLTGYSILRLLGIIENLKPIFNKRNFKRTNYEKAQLKALRLLIKQLN